MRKGRERNEAQECEKQRKRGNILTGMLCALGLFVLLHRFDSLSQMQVTVLVWVKVMEYFKESRMYDL